MVDISMCAGSYCPIRNTCYRHTAKPDSHWQSYIGARYEDGECANYWPTEPDVKRKTPPTEYEK